MASYEDLVNRIFGDQPTLSRREMLRQGAAAVVGGGASVLIGPPPLLAQGPQNAAATAAAEAERQAPGKTTGLKTRALVRYADKLETETLTLLPLHPQHVVIRNQAAQCCYSTTNVRNTATPVMNAQVAGHGGVGIVDEIGSAVKRVRVGDQVIIDMTTHCRVRSNCLNGRGDLCYQLATRPRLPSATMSDGTPVDIAFLPSAYSEYEVVFDDLLLRVERGKFVQPHGLDGNFKQFCFAHAHTALLFFQKISPGVFKDDNFAGDITKVEPKNIPGFDIIYFDNPITLKSNGLFEDHFVSAAIDK